MYSCKKKKKRQHSRVIASCILLVLAGKFSHRTPNVLGSCFFWPTTDKRRDALDHRPGQSILSISIATLFGNIISSCQWNVNKSYWGGYFLPETGIPCDFLMISSLSAVKVKKEKKRIIYFLTSVEFIQFPQFLLWWNIHNEIYYLSHFSCVELGCIQHIPIAQTSSTTISRALFILQPWNSVPIK